MATRKKKKKKKRAGGKDRSMAGGHNTKGKNRHAGSDLLTVKIQQKTEKCSASWVSVHGTRNGYVQGGYLPEKRKGHWGRRKKVWN